MHLSALNRDASKTTRELQVCGGDLQLPVLD